ncbi:MAG: hypothetical protein OJF49_004187 [Ktedonobacterales bacterium]|jgi:membrane protein implicated in regulation of membrane protease activity|nr:MAG: hypothetical protein OJF49_004187 [Ktedonobacterales bacterium]
MIATDPLSLLCIGCIVFSGGFLVISTVTGLGHAHGVHLGGDTGGHGLHLSGDTGHAGHAAHVADTGHAVHNGAHTAHTANGTDSTSSTVASSPLSMLTHALSASLNLYGLLIFLLIFGLVGYLLNNVANLGAVATIAVALLVGLISAVGSSLLLARLFVGDDDSGLLTRASSQLEGRLGTVSIAIRPGGIGEVIYPGVTGARSSVGARSVDGEAIPTGAEIVVLDYRDGIASVQSWDHFSASLRAGDTPQLEPLDRQG